MQKMKKYSREQILWAARVGEVSMIDAEHICSILDTIQFRCPDCGERLHMYKTGDMITDQFCFSCKKDIPITRMIEEGGEE